MLQLTPRGEREAGGWAHLPRRTALNALPLTFPRTRGSVEQMGRMVGGGPGLVPQQLQPLSLPSRKHL